MKVGWASPTISAALVLQDSFWWALPALQNSVLFSFHSLVEMIQISHHFHQRRQITGPEEFGAFWH